ncbi:MAG: recombinase family protein, partial [Clostridia bacterium]|nr:recombinase family protein [Clostridia bacterium]
NIVIYARYSSDAQRRDSIKQQVDECTKYAEKNDMNIVKVYKDEAKTGRNDDRDDFQRMLRDSRHKTFDAVLVWKFDRFARNMRDALNNEHILEENGVKVISATELIPDGAIGIIVKAVLLGINEYYSVDLSEKTQRGSSANAQLGKFLGGTVPFGFKIVDREYTVDEETAPYVKKIFSMYASGVSIVNICQYMNERGIRSSLGAKFNGNSLHHMLKNERYLGTYIYKDVVIPNRIPKLIDKSLFDDVQKVLEQNKKNPARKRAKEDYILSDKLFCGHCKDKGIEEKMVGHSGNADRKYCYYKCKNEKNCGKKMVGKQFIEEYVLEKCKLLLTDKNINTIARKISAIAERDNANHLLVHMQKQVQEKIKAKDNQLKTLDTCEDDTIRQEIFARVKELKAEIDSLESSIAIEKTKTLALNEEEIKCFLTQFRDYDILNIAHRKALINMLVNRIYLYDNHDGGKKKSNYKITVILNAGKETVEITEELYKDIKSNTGLDKFCILNDSLHQSKIIRTFHQ